MYARLIRKARHERERVRRKQQILSAAKRLCAVKEFEKVTIKDIASAAELSPGTVYLYFNNKDEIYSALSIRLLKHLNVGLKRITANKDLSGRDVLKAVKQSICEVHAMDPFLFTTFYHLQAGPALDHTSDHLRREILGLLRQTIECISEILAPYAAPLNRNVPSGIGLIMWCLVSSLIVCERSAQCLQLKGRAPGAALDLAFEIFWIGISGLSQGEPCDGPDSARAHASIGSRDDLKAPAVGGSNVRSPARRHVNQSTSPPAGSLLPEKSSGGPAGGRAHDSTKGGDGTPA